MTAVGRERSEAEYVWPPGIVQPERPPILVYLDLNCWIALAKCMTGHPDGQRHADVLSACRDAVEAGTARFPISIMTYHEVANISQHRQRQDLRETIEEVARYWAVIPRLTIMALEIEAMLDQRVGPSRNPLRSVNYLDWGVMRAFGIVGTPRILNHAGIDVTDDRMASYPQGPAGLQRLLVDAELELSRQVMEAPTPAEEFDALIFGWHPSQIRQIGRRRAEQEVRQSNLFDNHPEARRGRIRDIVTAIEIIVEIQDDLSRGLDNRDAELLTVFPSPTEARKAIDSMPSFDVAVTIKTAYHRNPEHRWTVNDIRDIDALAATIPYCDVIVTDKAAAATVNQAGLSERLNTTVLGRLEHLPDALCP